MERGVRDVMTREVVTVGRSTTFKEIVRAMQEHSVSALPVVDDEARVVGVVSEADLLLKEEQGSHEGGHALRPRHGRIDRAKAAGLVATQLMSSPALTVLPGDTFREAARLMHDRRVKRLPVVDMDGRVVGIVSRSDLLKVFLRPDPEIAADIKERVLQRILSLEPGAVEISVRDGVVRIAGQVELGNMIPLVVELLRGVEGVVGVESHLGAKDDGSVRSALTTSWVRSPYHGV